MRAIPQAAAVILAAILLLPGSGAALAQQTRVKDIATLSGLGEASVSALGLVVGLAGTGDSRPPPGIGSAFPLRPGRDTAVVMVTARLASGLRAGARIDATVAAYGDARSLAGGVLVPTPLDGANGQTLAVAEGSVAAGGWTAHGVAQSVTHGSPTTGSISGGATILADLPFDPGADGDIRFLLRRPDFTTAGRVARAINGALGRPLARALDHAAVAVTVPAEWQSDLSGLIATAENAVLIPDRPARRVVVDGRTGTIVAGLDIPLAPVAISHGGLTIRVTETPMVSQPPPFSSGGRTMVVPRSGLDVSENGRGITIPAGGTVGDLIVALDRAGLSALDRIAVIQAVQAAGGFEAELVAR